LSRANTILAVFAVVVTSALGIVLARSIPSAVFPELVFPRAIVLADSGELPSEQMLVAVTRPLEEAAYSAIGTKLVRSTTTRGSAEIDVTFTDSTDPIVGFQLLNAALAEVRGRLPAGTTYDTRLLTTGTFPIIDISLSSKIRSLPELTDIAFYDMIPSFHRIAGVYRVELVGGKYREYVVRVDPARMLAHRLSPQQVVDGLAAANVIASAGRIIDSHQMLLTVVTSNLHREEQLLDVPVANVGGQPVHVSDIGSVELGIREDYIRTTSEHGPAVLVGISRLPGGSTEQIAAEARKLIEGFRHSYPDVSFSISYDQAALVSESFRSVRDAIVLGLVLAVLIVWVFTQSAISALIAAIVVPCTVAITIVVMKALGLTFNMMTLGGLAAGIGLFIDDAIVMIEAIHRAHAAGAETGTAVSTALAELGRPLIASTATVIVVFVPLVLLSGVTGSFFRALAATLGAGLAISLALALYFTPALEMILRRLRRPAREGPGFFGGIQRAYAAGLRPFLGMPAFALALGAAVIVAGFALYEAVPTDYLPALDEGAFTLDYMTPPQSSLADTTLLLGKIENILRATPEVAAFSRRTGTQLGFFLTESNRGDLSVRLKANRTRDIYQVMDSVRDRILAAVPGVQIEFSQMLQDLIGDLSGVPEPIEVKVFGSDQATIRDVAKRVAERIRKIPGLVDVFDGVVLSLPEEQVLVDETAAERYHISADDIRAVLDTVVRGTVATSIRTGDRLYDVRVRYPDSFHSDLAMLSEVMLQTPQGGKVPLSSVVRLTSLGERAELDRERLRPVLHVTARLSGTDLGTAIARVKDSLANLALPPGVTLEYGGLYAEQQKAFSELTLVLIAAVVGVFLILLWEFARLAPALGVLFGAIPCLAGSLLGLIVTGVTLNISSFMGLIMVVGIAAKNGILLLDRAEREVAAGVSPRDAMIEAANVRIRPILMTTLATAAGLLPLALGLGAGAKVQQPLAIVVIGGLAFAMTLSIPLAGGVYLLGRARQ
jgi:CzcA family heavy metal efflux pump